MRIDNLYRYGNNIQSLLTNSKSCVLYQPPHNLEVIDNETFIGLEIEVERVQRQGSVFRLPNGSFLWNNTSDGSLRNDGREFVSVPIKGKEIPFALEKLYSTFVNDEACKNFEFNFRTGLHVHVNVRDMTEEQVISLITTYVITEDFFYAFAGKERQENIYCVPVTCSDKLEDLTGLFLDFQEQQEHNNKGGLDRHVIYHLVDSWTKYMGLNLRPLREYGTVEFRHLKGQESPAMIIHWINLIFKLKQYAMTHSSKDIIEEIKTLNTTSGYLKFARDIFGDLLDIIPQINIEQSLEKTTTKLKTALTNMDKRYEIFYPNSYLEKASEKFVKSNFLNFLIKQGYLKVVKKIHGGKESSKKSIRTNTNPVREIPLPPPLQEWGNPFGAIEEQNLAELELPLADAERNRRIDELAMRLRAGGAAARNVRPEPIRAVFDEVPQAPQRAPDIDF